MRRWLEEEKRIRVEYYRLEKERIRTEQCLLMEELESMRAEQHRWNVQLRSSPDPRDRRATVCKHVPRAYKSNNSWASESHNECEQSTG